MFDLENDESIWEISNTLQPFSKDILKKYLKNAHQDLFTAKQLRLVICYHSIPMGLIDLFNFDPLNHRAGLGVLLLPKYQSKGFAFEAIQLFIRYAFIHLQIHQLYANITTDNVKSLKLFQKVGFEIVGNKKEWIYSKTKYKDELLLQLINND